MPRTKAIEHSMREEDGRESYDHMSLRSIKAIRAAKELQFNPISATVSEWIKREEVLKQLRLWHDCCTLKVPLRLGVSGH